MMNDDRFLSIFFFFSDFALATSVHHGPVIAEEVAGRMEVYCGITHIPRKKPKFSLSTDAMGENG